jgi:hypothetical protein
MDRYALTKEESTVLNTVAAALRTLPEASQYKVLRNLAHFMDREVVRCGATRAAAAVAGTAARVQVSEKPERAQRPKVAGRSRPKGGYPPEFLAKPETACLLKEKELAEKAMTDPPTEDQRARLRAASAALRDAFSRYGSSA